MIRILTRTQLKILMLIALGYSVKEIADKLTITINTVNTHLKNIKERLHLQKMSELSAYYWCQTFGSSLEAQRKSLLSAFTCIFFLISFQFSAPDKRRCRFRSRREQTYEYVTFNNTL